MGAYDIPAFLQYIKKETGKAKVSLLGHSEGTTSIFAALTDPRSTKITNELVDVFIALAPVVYVTNESSGFLDFYSKHGSLIEKLLKRFKVSYLFQGECALSPTEEYFYKDFCQEVDKVCREILGLVGADPKYDALRNERILLDHYPSGTSLRQLDHLKQMINEKKNNPVFKMFDFGPNENFLRYKSKTPPIYDLSKI